MINIEYFDPTSFQITLGLGVIIGLALTFSYYTNKDIDTFILYATIFTCFMVGCEFIDLWVLILLLIVDIIILYLNLAKYGEN